MSNTNSKFIADYVYLAETSYADFSGIDYTDNTLVQNRIKEAGKSAQFAELVTQNYTVEAHWEDKAGDGIGSLASSESGFSGTLFKGTGKDGGNTGYVLALKGTAGAKDLAVVDGGDITHDGLAHHQIVDLYNFWQQITSTEENYTVADIRTDKVLSALYQASSMLNIKDFFIKYQLEGKGYFIDSGTVKQVVMTKSHELYDINDDRYNALGIDPKSVVVTGHSLGGHLSAAFSRLFPDVTDHAYMINGAGYGGRLNVFNQSSNKQEHNIHEIFSFLGGANNFDTNNITNITGDKAMNFVAQDWTIGLEQPGQQPEIFIEAANLDAVLGHGVGQMSDSMAVIDLFLRIDKSLANKSIAEILTQFNTVLKIAANEDNKTLENIVNALDKLYFGKNAEAVPIDDRGALYKRILALQTAIGKDSTAKVITDVGEIISEASEATGTAARYALKMLNPFAVVSDTLYDKEGVLKEMLPELVQIKLDDKTTYAGMSETYIQKRAEMLDLLVKINAKSPHVAIGYYKDIASQQTAGSEMGSISSSSYNFSRIIFGTEEDDVKGLTGSEHKDYLFGGAGKDTLTGGKGNDYLEGGIGYDTYYIEDHDTISDSDMLGRLMFGKVARTATI